MNSEETINSIIDFWFSEEIIKRWFNSTPELDLKIKSLFESTYQSAVDGNFNDWQTTPLGCLALILLFDQFPLNMYRGKLESFLTEAKSRDVAAIAIESNFDENLSKQQKTFMYMPFMHSENIDDQNKAIELFTKADLKDNLRYARHHHDIIKRFGRFPHRNKILERKNTADEDEYLKSGKAFLG